MASIYKVLGQSVSAESQKNIVNKEISSNVVTLTTDTDHNIIVGQTVTLAENAQSATLSTKEITGNVATLSTVNPNRIKQGQVVTIAGVDTIFDGVHTVTAITGNSFSYSLTNADIASTVATGTVEFSDLAFNGTFVVDSNPTTTTFTYTTASDDLTSTAATNFTMTHIPWEVVYTCPAETATVMSSIVICNQSEVPTTYQVAIAPSLDLSNENLLYYNDVLEPSDTITITGGFIVDATTKYFMVGADVENVSVTAFGSEVS